MRKQLILIVALFSIIVAGCHQPGKKQLSTAWTRIVILSENRTEIAIQNGDDSTKVIAADDGSFLGGYHKPEIDSLTTFFTAEEKDTLFSLTEEIIANHVAPKSGCSDFVGELNLTIYYGRPREPGSYEQTIKYNGGCNWEKLSPETEKFYSILKRRIKWWQQ